MKRHSIKLGQRPGILVIADDECDAAVQLAGLVPIEQVNQAMVITRDQKCNWDLSPSKDCLPVEPGRLGQRSKRDRRSEATGLRYRSSISSLWSSG